ncbi:Ger(x)C family spore germination protein [Paenibacillus sp. sptzw28]|uniref:Ger(x)C family spore germination protein n=1 Tax=Paenibacillus sp. sptzw28 TaxID=715179 RepID=UPI001C6E73DC|nr:Ger(x)C family spore germination protein [Paenibacillus sp. sptzw28]QYR19539.1 Ger(x)C family spore germination protein [Paenibacillus sp. sptzw28]
MPGPKRVKTILLLLLLGLTFPLLAGCWDRLEIEERAVILAIAIDKAAGKEGLQESEVSHIKGAIPAPDTGQIRLTAQIAVPGRIPLGPGEGGGGSSSQKPVWVLSATGHSIDDAMMVLQQELADRIFLGHLRVIIVSEQVARRGMGDINDYLRRNPEVRRLAWLAVSRRNAGEMMKAAPQLERVPGLYLMAMFDHAVQMGKYPNEFIGVFWSKASSKGVEPILPVLEIKDSGNIEIKGLAYFKKDKLVGTSKPLEIGLYMALTNVHRGGYTGFVPMHGLAPSIMVRSTHRKTLTKVYFKDGEPRVNVHIFLEHNVEENILESFPIDKQRDLDEIAERDSALVKEAAAALIKETQKAGSDIFGFGEHFRAKMPGYWNRHVRTKTNWEEIYKDLPINVHATVRMRRVGMKAK